MPPVQYHSQAIDHLGLVAGMCKELGIAEHIDRRAPKESEEWNISHGEAVVAMIINGLGFNGRTLHMYSQYFANKPLDRLIRKGIEPEHINDKVLGRTLDTLFDQDVSKVYSELAIKVVKLLKLPCNSVHLDGTSFHLDGCYNSDAQDNGDDFNAIRLCRGYSRDHRPDLNQAILLLMTENKAGIPLFMKAVSGNVTDTTSFNRFVSQHLKSFKAALEAPYFVADAALYTADTIQRIDRQKQYFVSRVPLTISDSKALVDSAPSQSMQSLEGFEHYQVAEVSSDYAEVDQRWLLFRNQQSAETERKTLTKRMQKQSLKEANALKKLSKKAFQCQSDAIQAFEQWQKSAKWCQATPQVVSKPCYRGKGRPAKGVEPDSLEYYIVANCCIALEQRLEAEASLGCFVLATNDLNSDRFNASDVLSTYKSQQQVERGFRFLKSPDFLVSSLYLKKPERIEALLMIMTLCLMVYAALQHRIRFELKKQSRTFPDMKKKGTQNPTARWVFSCFEGIHVLTVNERERYVTGFTDHHNTIVFILGAAYQSIYS